MAGDLEDRAASMLVDQVFYGELTFDPAHQRGRLEEAVWEEAENAVIYHHDAMDIISHYESHRLADTDYDYGDRRYSATEWREAMAEYACGIAASVLRGLAEEALDDIAETAETLCAYAADNYGLDISAEDLGVSTTKPYAGHIPDIQTDGGIRAWHSLDAEGSNVLAAGAHDVWLFYVWVPQKTGEEGEDTPTP